MKNSEGKRLTAASLEVRGLAVSVAPFPASCIRYAKERQKASHGEYRDTTLHKV